MACRLPGAASVAEFWRLLVEGVDAITDLPRQRNTWAKFHSLPAGKLRHSNGADVAQVVSLGGWLTDVDSFDPSFFQLSPRVAQSLDPQQRLLLEVAWETLEDLGMPARDLAQSLTGVFIGASNNDYRQEVQQPNVDLDPYACTGNATSMLANRLSYFFDLRGPSLTIDTACSSSLGAVHLACQSLRGGECRLALAGGVNLILSPEISVSFAKAGGLAADGRCKAFDAQADGIVRSEGVALVALKRLRNAHADGDRIYAVIRGSAVNQDGRSNGITAPSQVAQTQVIQAAWRQASRHLRDADYVETHGAGTLLGDVIETQSLRQAVGTNCQPDLSGSARPRQISGIAKRQLESLA